MIRTEPIRRLLLLAALLLPAAPAPAAVVLSLEASDRRVAVGESLMLDILVSGLEPPGPGSLSVSGFDLDLAYDPNLFSLDTVAFGTGLNREPPDELFQNYFDDFLNGIVNLQETSLETQGYLEANQPEAFLLATLNFTGLAPGDGLFFFTRAELSDAGAGELPVAGWPAVESSVTVGDAETVPVPALATFSTGIFILATVFRRYRGR